MGKLAALIAAKMARSRDERVVMLRDVRQTRQMVADMMADVRSPETLMAQGRDPLHALYIIGQNRMSVFAEALSTLPEFKKFARIVAKAEDMYIPGGPPMSPLTVSYFTMWAMCDVRVDKQGETMGSCLADLIRLQAFDPLMVAAFEAMQASRMGFYEHLGFREGRVVLQDILTGAECSCVVPAGHAGDKGELWYVRVLPPIDDRFGYSVVFTTPYVLLKQGRADWLAFFLRQDEAMGRAFKVMLPERRSEAFLKFGLSDYYWNEFIFQGYVNATANVIWLTGLPDVPDSLPHA
jgi:hypothetical protein